MMLLCVRPTPFFRRRGSSAAGNPLPRTSPARSLVPTKTSGSRFTGKSPSRAGRSRLDHPYPVERGVFAPARQPVDQEPAGLAAPQRGVGAARRQQPVVGAFLDDAAPIEHDEP